MAYINKPKKKKEYHKSEKNSMIHKIYSSKKWVDLRTGYFLEHPLCEKCLEKGITKPAEEVHHIKPIGTGKNLIEMEEIAYNPYNLMSLCKDCHHEIHKQMRKK